jgi:hypothetical protein
VASVKPVEQRQKVVALLDIEPNTEGITAVATARNSRAKPDEAVDGITEGDALRIHVTRQLSKLTVPKRHFAPFSFLRRFATQSRMAKLYLTRDCFF